MENGGSDSREVARDRSSCIRIKSKRKEAQLFTKVILRRLPPRLTQEELISQLNPVPEYNYFYFVKPDWSLGTHAYARAYINFVNPKDVFQFKNKYDGHIFGDDKESKYATVVEYAPFQRIPKKRLGRKKDDKCGTIETSDVYKQFTAVFTGLVDVQPVNDITFWKHKVNEKKYINTPLLDFIQQKLEKQKFKNQQRELRDKERKFRREERKKTLRETMASIVIEN